MLTIDDANRGWFRGLVPNRLLRHLRGFRPVLRPDPRNRAERRLARKRLARLGYV